MPGTTHERTIAASHTGEDEEIVLDWTIHLARRSPRKLLGVVVAAFVVGVIGYWVFSATLPVVVMLLALVGSVSEFLLPSTYRLTSKTASAYSGLSRTTMQWSSVRRVCAGVDGVRLSPFVRPSRLDAFRGVYLRFDNNRAEVMEAIRKLRDSSDD